MKWVLALFLFSTFALAESVSKVTIPVEEYIRLRETSELPSLTIIENILISGEYGKTLKLTVSGASAGKPVVAPFLELSRANLYDCKGNAVLKRENGQLALLPLSSRFQLSCSLSFLNWNEANLTFLNALYVKADVTGAETIMGGEGERQSLTLTRVAPIIEDDRAEITATARYRITVVPEESRFDYTFQLSNPSRNKRSFSVPLINGEIVQTVSAEGEYKDSKEEVVLTLMPGNNQVQMKGRLTATAFKPPLKTQSFILIENSPMLQLSLETKARRLSAKDAGMYGQFTSHRAFLLSATDSLSWTTKKLEVFASTGFSLNSANYTYYVPKKGKGVVQAIFEINNQGTPEIPLKIPGKILYAEIGNIPQALFKDQAGQLVLQVPTGVQTVLIQYEGEVKGAMGFGSLTAELARPQAVISNANVQLQLNNNWELISGRALDEAKSDIVFSDFIWSIAAGLFLFWLSARMGFLPKHAFVIAVSFALASAFLPKTIELLFIAVMVGAVARYRNKIKSLWPATLIGKAGFIIVSIMVLFLVIESKNTLNQSLTRQDSFTPAAPAMISASYEGAGMAKGKLMGARSDSFGAVESESLSMNDAPTAETQSAGSDYQGLPARVQIPSDGHTLTFSQGLLAEKAPAEIKIFLLGKWFGTLFMLLGLLGVAWMLFRNHLRIKDYVLNGAS